MKYRMMIVTFLFSGALAATGQSDWQLQGKSIPELRIATQKPLLVNNLSSFQSAFVFSKTTPPSYPALQSQFSMTTSPKAWCYSELALFCKLEVQLEKATRFPVKFRLGETQQVERMEGKLGDGVKKKQ